jgi:O-methyltransferase
MSWINSGQKEITMWHDLLKPRKVLRNIAELPAGFKLSSTSVAVRKQGLTYLTNRKLLNLQMFGAEILRSGIPGDIAEFGVALGGSGIILASTPGNDRTYFGFDVFGMIPPPNPDQDDGKSIARYNEIASGKSRGIGDDLYYGYQQDLLARVQSNFRTFGILPSEKVRFAKGLFTETWPVVSAQIANLALVHIDCDWFDPVKFCLECCKEKLSAGGIVIVDDYNDYAGANRASREFLLTNKDFEVLSESPQLILRRLIK